MYDLVSPWSDTSYTLIPYERGPYTCIYMDIYFHVRNRDSLSKRVEVRVQRSYRRTGPGDHRSMSWGSSDRLLKEGADSGRP